MKSKKLSQIIVAAFLLCAALTATAQNTDKTDRTAPGEDVVLQWNRVLAQTIATPGAHPATIMTQRSYAMMQRNVANYVFLNYLTPRRCNL